jgi:hypothetical protein
MLRINEHVLPMRKAATMLLTGVVAILGSTVSAQTGPVRAVEAISSIPLDATFTSSFEHETCDAVVVTQCSKATINVFSTPVVEMSNVLATAGSGSVQLVTGSTLTYHVTATNIGPGSAGNLRLIEASRAGVNCPDSGMVSVISGPALPGGNYRIADLMGPGVPLAKLDIGQSTTLTYSCQVN